MSGVTLDVNNTSLAMVVDDLTRLRMDRQQWDYSLDIEIRGICIGTTDKVRWQITQALDENGEYEEHNEMYLADVLEKVVQVIRTDHGNERRRCPHDGQICNHECEGDACWRELDGS